VWALVRIRQQSLIKTSNLYVNSFSVMFFLSRFRWKAFGFEIENF